MNGLMTEREWRRQAAKRDSRRPAWCGAQCVMPSVSAGKRLRGDPAFRLFLLMSAMAVAAVLPLLFPPKQAPSFAAVQNAAEAVRVEPRTVPEIDYQPPLMNVQTRTFSRSELLRGKLLLLDEAHPLPGDVLPPNTFSIAAVADGMVPVAALNLQSGRETISALRELFAALRRMGAEGLTVTQGTVSAGQQRQTRRAAMAARMRTQPPSSALQAVSDQMDAPSTGEMLQEYAVEIRLRAAPDQPLEQSPQGQALLQMAWRHGFVRTNPEKRPFRFRYVGRAHATAMTYLDVKLEEYLLWLHQKGALTVSAEGHLRYLILCQPMNGDHASLSLPVAAECELSLDNMGYAIAACTW